VNPIKAREESLKRTDPEEYKKQKVEAYVTGEGNPQPAVITFTTETATMAVNELLQRLTGFRKEAMFDHYINRVHILFEDKKDYRKPGPPINEDCPICSLRDYWGIGDITPFLDVAN